MSIHGVHVWMFFYGKSYEPSYQKKASELLFLYPHAQLVQSFWKLVKGNYFSQHCNLMVAVLLMVLIT